MLKYLYLQAHKSCLQVGINLSKNEAHQEEMLQRPEANIINKKDKLLGRFIPYLTCKIWNKDTQYVVLFKHDVLGIFIPYFTRKIWN